MPRSLVTLACGGLALAVAAPARAEAPPSIAIPSGWIDVGPHAPKKNAGSIPRDVVTAVHRAGAVASAAEIDTRSRQVRALFVATVAPRAGGGPEGGPGGGIDEKDLSSFEGAFLKAFGDRGSKVRVEKQVAPAGSAGPAPLIVDFKWRHKDQRAELFVLPAGGGEVRLAYLCWPRDFASYRPIFEASAASALGPAQAPAAPPASQSTEAPAAPSSIPSQFVYLSSDGSSAFRFAVPPAWLDVGPQAPSANFAKFPTEVTQRFRDSGFSGAALAPGMRAFFLAKVVANDDGVIDHSDLAEFADHLQRTFGSQNGMKMKVLEENTLTVAGVSSGRMVAELQWLLNDMKAEIFVIPGGTDEARLVYLCAPRDFDGYRPLFEASAGAIQGAAAGKPPAAPSRATIIKLIAGGGSLLALIIAAILNRPRRGAMPMP